VHVSSGDLERAGALYHGPFLDGFYVSDAGPFERWSTTSGDGARVRTLVLPVSSVVFSRGADGKVTGFEAGNGRARGIRFDKVSRPATDR
jgi:hypothetical protein